MGCGKSKSKTIDAIKHIDLNNKQDYEEKEEEVKQEVSLMRADDQAMEVEPPKKQPSGKKKLEQKKPEQIEPQVLQESVARGQSFKYPTTKLQQNNEELDEFQESANDALKQKMDFPNEKPNFDFDFLENQENPPIENKKSQKENLMEKLLEDISDI